MAADWTSRNASLQRAGNKLTSGTRQDCTRDVCLAIRLLAGTTAQ